MKDTINEQKIRPTVDHLIKTTPGQWEIVKQVLLLMGIVFSGILFSHCALQGMPTGGLKDTIAPQIVETTPADKSRNFTGKEIELTFDEYVQVENLQQELIVTPDAQSEYEYKSTKYGVKLIFKKPFTQPNTTYTINFRSAIKDITEKNIAQDAKLVFSTGPGLDTLYVEGSVNDLATGQYLANAVISLYKANDTLDIQKHRPYYFTKTDTSGNYRLENISPGEYKMYALSEKDNNQRYNQEKEKIDFLPKALIVRDSSQLGVNFKVSVVDENPPKVATKTVQSDNYIIEMNEGLISADILLDDSTKRLAYIIDPRDSKTIRLYNTIQSYDSLSLKIIAQDSSENISTSKLKIKFNKLDEKQAKRKTNFPFEVTTSPASGEAILRDLRYKIQFSKPVGKYDLTKIHLLADTLTPIPLDVKKDFQWNNSRSQLTISKRLEVKWGVRVEAPKETFFSVENDTATALKNDYNIKDPEKYGSISGRVSINEKHYIIQLLDNGGEVVAQLRNQPNYAFSYLVAGEYSLRVIIDRNNNGKWDPASFKDRRTAENIIYGFKKKKLKENWELTENVQI